MIKYKKSTIQTPALITCDVCGEQHDVQDFEGININHTFGYGSFIIGDGVNVKLDICEKCLNNVLGSWLRKTNTWESEDE